MPEVGNTADTPNPLLKEIWESPRVNENLTSVGFEPTTSGLYLPMLYRLSYEASPGAVNRGRNRGKCSNVIDTYMGTAHIYMSNPEVVGSNPTEVKFSLTRGDSQISFKRVNTLGDLVYRQYCLLPAPKHIKT